MGDSDLDQIDFENFKGIYEGEQKEKFICPETGAHFEYFDLCKRMSRLREQRKLIDQALGVVHPPLPQQQRDSSHERKVELITMGKRMHQ